MKFVGSLIFLFFQKGSEDMTGVSGKRANIRPWRKSRTEWALQTECFFHFAVLFIMRCPIILSKCTMRSRKTVQNLQNNRRLVFFCIFHYLLLDIDTICSKEFEIKPSFWQHCPKAFNKSYWCSSIFAWIIIILLGKIVKMFDTLQKLLLFCADCAILLLPIFLVGDIHRGFLTVREF